MKKVLTYTQEEFSLDMLRAMGTPKQAIDYCTDKLEFIARGSARTVFRLTENSVLKVANTDMGISTIEHEAIPRFQELCSFAKIYETAPNKIFSIMEYANPFTEENCVEILGYTFPQISEWIRYNVHPDEEEERPYFKAMENIPFFIDLKTAFIDGILKFEELDNITAWGYVMDGENKRPVIVDYGV